MQAQNMDITTILIIVNHMVRLSVLSSSDSANVHPWMFLPLDIPFGYCIGHITFGLFCVMVRFSSRIF